MYVESTCENLLINVYVKERGSSLDGYPEEVLVSKAAVGRVRLILFDITSR
jgi:hypothetical protein